MEFTEEQFIRALCKEDLYSFTQGAFSVLHGGAKLLSNFHVEYIAYEMRKIIFGDNKRMIINIPPRSLKSFCFSVVLPAYILGKDPSAKLICVSYSQSLAEDLGQQCLSLMESSWYKNIFPQTKISTHTFAKGDFKTTKNGRRLATSIDGTLTGSGADYIIIDDPLKPGEVYSSDKVEKVNKWYGNTLVSRLDQPKEGKIALVMQRIHENDLTGYLQSTAENWKVVSIPAIAKEKETWTYYGIGGIKKKFTRRKGQALHPERQSESDLKKLKELVGSYVFSSQYQQEPCPLDGSILKREWIQYYEEKPIDPDMLLFSWDTACETGANNDYSVCTVWAIDEKVVPKKYYLLETIRGKYDFPKLLEKIKAIRNEYCGLYPDADEMTLVEKASSGIQVLQVFNKEDFKIKAIKVRTDKEARFLGITNEFERGSVLFPQKASWLETLENELLRFPGSKNDDQVDSVSQALSYRKTKSFVSTTEIFIDEEGDKAKKRRISKRPSGKNRR